MNKKLVNRLLSLAMAAAVSMTSVVPSYAANPDEPVFDETEPTDDLDDQEDPENGNPDNGQPANPENTPNPDNTPNPNNTPDPEDPENTPDPEQENSDDVVIPENTDNTTDPLDPENVEGQEIKAAITVEYSLNGGMLNEEDTDKTSFEGVVGQEMTISLSAATFENMEFAGWYTTADYSDTDFVVTENTWTYTFTPEEEEVSLHFYALFSPANVTMNAPTEHETGERLEFVVDPGEGGNFYLIEMDDSGRRTQKNNRGSFTYGELDWITAYLLPTSVSKYSADHGQYITPNVGYKFEGIYLDSNFENPLWEIDVDSEIYDAVYSPHYEDSFFYDSLYADLKAALEDDTQTPTLYLKWSKITSLKIAEKNQGILLDGQTFKSGDKFPELGSSRLDPLGYTQTGWYYKNAAGKQTNIIPGQTAIEMGYRTASDGYIIPNYAYSKEDGCYYIDVYPTRTMNSYTVTYHLTNAPRDISVKKTYTVRDLGGSLDIMAGDISDNSAIDRSSFFLGWSLTENGNVDFDSTKRISDLINYADDNNLKSIDLYGKWDAQAEYSYTVKVEPGAGAETGDLTGSDLANSDNYTFELEKDDSINLTGREFVREGYTLTGWRYYRGSNAVVLKASGSFSNFAMKADDEVTLTPQWTPDTYTIKYNYNGGKAYYSRSNTQTYNRDAKTVYIITGYSLEKTGYRFAGWRTDDGRILNESFTGIYENLNLTAQWEPVEYKVSIDAGNGFVPTQDGDLQHGSYEISLKYGEEYNLSDAPITWAGHTIKGYTGSVNGKKVTYAANAKIKNLVTTDSTWFDSNGVEHVDVKTIYLEVVWEAPNYTITYNLNGGKTTDAKATAKTTYNADTAKTDLPTCVTRDGYTFAGWKAADGEYTYYAGDIFKNLALTAQWTPITYTVTVLDDDEKTILFNDKFAYDESVSVGSLNLTKPGYKLNKLFRTVDNKTVSYGANATLKNITGKEEAIVLNTEWTPVNYTLTYNLNGGKVTDRTVKTKETYNKKDNSSATPLLNYAESEDTTESEDTYVIAAAADQKVVRTGYIFRGWSAAGTGYTYYGGDIYENLTLTAMWEPISYYIYVDGNGGSMTIIDRNGQPVEAQGIRTSVYYDQPFSLKNVSFVRDGYKFKNFTVDGKSYSASGTLKNVSVTPGEEIDVKVNWTPISYTITYDLAGGKLPSGKRNVTKYTPDTGAAIVYAPVKAGYTFAGWKLSQKGVADGAETASYEKDNDGNYVIAGGGDNYGNIILTAIWDETSYNIAFDGLNTSPREYNNLTYDKTVSFGSAAKALEALDDSHEGSIKGFALTQEDVIKNKVTYNLTSDYAVSKILKADQTSVTLYPVWGTTKTYHISYDVTDDVKISKKLYVYSKNDRATQTLPTVTKTGFVFGGWEVIDGENVLTSDGKKIEKGKADDITIKPILTPISYTVSLSPNAKDVAEEGKTLANKATVLGAYTYNNSEEVTEVLPNATQWTRTGYTLAGFAKTARSTEPVDSLAALTTGKAITLYAIWTPNNYTITYDSNYLTDATRNVPVPGRDSIIGKTEQQTFGKAYKPVKAVLSGYTFDGWTVVKTGDADRDKAIMDAVTLDKNNYVTEIKATNTNNIKLQAHFTEYKYKLVINLNGGKLGNVGTANISGVRFATDVFTDGDVNLASYLAAEKKGYVLKGIALDKAGKKLVITADGTLGYYNTATYDDQGNIASRQLRGLSNKNNGTSTLYAIWDKVPTTKVDSFEAQKSGSTLTVRISDTVSADVAYTVEYSADSKFKTGIKSKEIGFGANSISITDEDLNNQNTIYVRVKRTTKDSTWSEENPDGVVVSAWSSTVRATRVVN